MEFRCATVINRKNKKARLAYVGLLICVFSMAAGFLPNGEDYIGYIFMTGAVIVIVGAFIGRGDITEYGPGEDLLVLTPDGISIGARNYPMQKINNLDFNVTGFAGMSIRATGMPAGASSDGMDNTLRFSVGETKVDTRFYLDGPQQAQALGALFDEFYRLHIPFIERNNSARTFLFQALSTKELEDFKIKYGY